MPRDKKWCLNPPADWRTVKGEASLQECLFLSHLALEDNTLLSPLISANLFPSSERACHSVERSGNEGHVGAAVLEACQNNYKFVTLLCPTFLSFFLLIAQPEHPRRERAEHWHLVFSFVRIGKKSLKIYACFCFLLLRHVFSHLAWWQYFMTGLHCDSFSWLTASYISVYVFPLPLHFLLCPYCYKVTHVFVIFTIFST